MNDRVTTTELQDYKRVIKDYCQQLYNHKFGNLDKGSYLLQRYYIYIPELTQGETKLKRPASIKFNQYNINSHKASAPEVFTAKFHQAIKEG